MKGHSLHWFVDLFHRCAPATEGRRSLDQACGVGTVITLVVSLMAGLAFRRRFSATRSCSTDDRQPRAPAGARLGIGLLFQWIGISPSWYTRRSRAAVLDACRLGVLVMFAVMSRFNSVWEEAARISERPLANHQIGGDSVLAPGLVAVALFASRSLYDEFARTLRRRLAQ